MTFTLEDYNSKNNSTFDKCNCSDSTIIKSNLATDYVFSSTIYNRLINGFSNINNSVKGLVDTLSNINTVYVKSNNKVDSLNQFCVKSFSIYEKDNIYYPNKYEIDKLVDNISTLLAGEYKTESGSDSNNVEIPLVNIDQAINREINYNNNLAFNNIINTNIITYSNIKILLTYLATILQHIKILKWSVYFKTNKFSGNTYVYTCSNIYPELPYNNENTKENTFYSAALLSPSAKRKDLGFLPATGIAVKAEKATNVYSFPSNLIAASQTDMSLNNITGALIYTTDETSDIPTFDILSENGSNGNFEIYRKVTTDTYDLVSQVYDILNLFNIKQSEVITAKSIIQAIDYIFELWHLNIQVLQYDYYLCHYNCHLNSLNGSGSGLSEDNVEYATYTITYDYSDIVNNTTLGSNVFSLDASRPTQYTFKYTGTFTGETYNTGYDPSVDTLKIQIPYVEYIGSNEAQVYVSAYILISNEKHNSSTTLREEIDKQYSIGNWSAIGEANGNKAPQQIPLSIQYINDIYNGENPAAARSLTGTYVLSSPGDLSVYYVVADSSKTKMAIDNSTVKFGTIAEGYIYEDSKNTIISNFISMGNREGRAFATSYNPTPTVSYKNNNSNTYTTIANLANAGLGFSYIRDNKVGLATISLTCSNDSHYYGSYSEQYKINEQARVSLNDSKMTIYLASTSKDDIYADTLNTWFSTNCFIYVHEQGATSAIANKAGITKVTVNGEEKTLNPTTDENSVKAFSRLFETTFPQINAAGTAATIILSPSSSYASNNVGDKYYYSSRSLSIPVKKRQSVLTEDSWSWVSIGHTFVCRMEGDAKKSRVHAKLQDPGGPYTTPDDKYYRTMTILVQIPTNATACAIIYTISRPGDATQLVGYIGAEYSDDGTALGSIVYSDRLSKSGSKHSTDHSDGQIKFEVDSKFHDTIRISLCTLSPNNDSKRDISIDVKFKTPNNAAIVRPEGGITLDGYTITYMLKTDDGDFIEDFVDQTGALAEGETEIAYTITYVPPSYDPETQNWSGWKADETLTTVPPTTLEGNITVYGHLTAKPPPEDPPAEEGG